ncbi:MAG: RNA methyltransferase [Clostridia bacterium]|nr:RNA methyltransferase [Clostridia bacterium]
MREYISSKSNEKIKTVRKLADKKYRIEYGLFVIEGHKLIGEYLGNGFFPLRFFVTEEAERKYDTIINLSPKSDICVIPRDLYLHISSEQAPQGILAVCQIPHRDNALCEGSAIILESIRDSGNLGTVIRTASALGIKNVLISSDCADLYNAKTLRASMGAIFRTNICISDDLNESVRELKKCGRRIFAAMPSRDAVDIRTVALEKNDCIVVGNEGNGITERLAECCNACVTIPMVAGAESLNASIAASVLMWELVRGLDNA